MAPAFEILDRQIAWLKNEFAEADQRVAERDARLKEAKKQVNECIAAIKNLNNQLNELRRTVQERDKTIASLQAELETVKQPKNVVARYAEPDDWNGVLVGKMLDALDLNRTELAAAIGVSETAVWGWEAGRYQPNGPNRRRLTDFAKAHQFTVELVATPEEAPQQPVVEEEPAPTQIIPPRMQQVWTATRITRFRMENHLSRSALASILSVAVTEVKRWETHKRSVPREIWQKLDVAEKVLREYSQTGMDLSPEAISEKVQEALTA